MIKVILLTLLVYWLFQLALFFFVDKYLHWDSMSELFIFGGLAFQVVACGLYFYQRKFQPWFNENFGYSIVYCLDDNHVRYCKRKYQYALLNQLNFMRCVFEVSDFCADKWKNDGKYYYDRYVPRYVKEMFLPIDKEICEYALELSNKEMDNLRGLIRGSANHV